MQVTKAQREVYIDNMLAAIGNIEYCPCDVTIPFGAHYDLGDVLQFPNAVARAETSSDISRVIPPYL